MKKTSRRSKDFFAKLLFIVLFIFLLGVYIVVLTRKLFTPSDERSSFVFFFTLALLFASTLYMVVSMLFFRGLPQKLSQTNPPRPRGMASFKLRLSHLFSFRAIADKCAGKKGMVSRQEGRLTIKKKPGDGVWLKTISRVSEIMKHVPSLFRRKQRKGELSSKKESVNKSSLAISKFTFKPKEPPLASDKRKKAFLTFVFIFAIAVFIIGFFWRRYLIIALSLVLMAQSLTGYRHLQKQITSVPETPKANVKGSDSEKQGARVHVQNPTKAFKVIPPQITLVIGKYQTELDALYELIQRYGRIKLSAIVKFFGIDKKQAEDWAMMLQDSRLAELHYPAFGEPEVRPWNEEKHIL